MPLLFQAKMASNPVWLSLDYDLHNRQYLWSSTNKAACSEAINGKVSFKNQARVLAAQYHIFSYLDSSPLDTPDMNGRTSAMLLNKQGQKPDFSEKTLERGWILPSGEFIGCKSGAHIDLVTNTLSVPIEQVREEGWILIQVDNSENEISPYCWVLPNKKLEPTSEQTETLIRLGFVPGSMRKSFVSDFDDHFEEMRHSLVSASRFKDAPVLLSPDAALKILDDSKSIHNQVDALINLRVSAILAFTDQRMQLLEKDPDKMAEALQEGTRLAAITFEAGDYVLGLTS